MNESYSFTPTHEGYMAAAAKIQEINDQGHLAGGDLARVRAYVG